MKKVELRNLQNRKYFSDIGQKASNLTWLIRRGWRVPVTYVLPYDVSTAYQRDPKLLIAQIEKKLSSTLRPNQSYAIRSSANMEDLGQHSYAGQFRTYLNLLGIDQILVSIQNVIESGGDPTVLSYTKKIDQDINMLNIAVIIQEMVSPVISGVAFSKNPLTGLDETVVEAVLGPGDALVQEGHTPFLWVNKWGTWITRPASDTIDIKLIEQIVTQTRQISQQYGSPVDLEWVFDGQQLYWVQLRPITGMDGINIYSNRISKEVFPGIIKPLIWSVNVPLVNGAWIEWLTELVGPNNLQPEVLAKAFAHRAYFNMGVIGQIITILGMPKETLELLLGLEGGENRPRFRPSRKTFMLMPRMIPFSVRVLRMGPEILPYLTEIRKELIQLQERNIAGLDEVELLALIDQLYAINNKVARFSIIVPILLNIYFAVLRRRLAKYGIDIAKFDLTAGLKELDAYNPNQHLTRLAFTYNQLDIQAKAEIEACETHAEFLRVPGVRIFQDQMAEFLSVFGYMSDRANDFSAVPWRETPHFVLEMILNETRQMNSSMAQDQLPEEQQKKLFQNKNDGLGAKEKYTWDTLPINGIRRVFLKPIYERARNFQLYREAVSATYSYGYGLFRHFFLEIGKRLQVRGVLEQPEDIFYLRWEEIKTIIHKPALDATKQPTAQILEIVAIRKMDITASQDILLPEIIYGDQVPPVIKPRDTGNILKGIASSRGYYQGRVKVIESVMEFSKLVSGDVLVIPYSDVSWTPLFTRAGAFIAESCGILSHSSIVAREYQIPAVVSVPGAMRLSDNLLVTVDGYRGEVILHTDKR